MDNIWDLARFDRRKMRTIDCHEVKGEEGATDLGAALSTERTPVDIDLEPVTRRQARASSTFHQWSQ